MTPENEFFANIVHTYTREEAVADGSLIPVTLPARERFKFDTGQVALTPGAMEALESANELADWYMARHQRGDWGELDAHDKQMNEMALASGDPGQRLFSSYKLSSGDKIYIITYPGLETTILLPEEY